MDNKERLRELTDFMLDILPLNGSLFILNGWEGLICYGTDGYFYQMSYKGPDNWHIAMWPNDIYGKKIWDSEDHEWVDKED